MSTTGESGVTQVDEKKPFLNLIIRGQDGTELSFRVKRNIQLKMLLNDYCENRSLEMMSIVFLLNGQRIRADQTPGELEMEEGDEIEAMLPQFGAGIWNASF